MGTHDESPAKGFTRADRRRLRQALAQAKSARLYRRIEAVLAVAEGASVQQAAQRVHCERSTVHRWLQRYGKGRNPQALHEGRHSGRRRLARELTAARLTRVLESEPSSHGFVATHWTVPLLCTHLREQGFELSTHTLRRRIHEARFRWKRPRYIYSERADHVGAKKGGSFAG